MAILENVLGFKTVAELVIQILTRNLPEHLDSKIDFTCWIAITYCLRYWIGLIIVNPAMIGAAIERRRIYVVMIRDDVLSDETLTLLQDSDDQALAFTTLVADRVMSMKLECTYEWNLAIKTGTKHILSGIFLYSVRRCMHQLIDIMMSPSFRKDLLLSETAPSVQKDREDRILRRERNAAQTLGSM